MAMEIRCQDLGIACDQVIRADTQEELIRLAVQHAVMVHGIDLTESQLLEQVRALVRTASPTR